MRHFYIVLNAIPVISKREVDHGQLSDEVAELCSCIRAALFLSHDIRRDVRVHLILLGERKDVVISGESVRYLSPDERSLCMLLIKFSERKTRKPWRGVCVKEFASLREIFPSDGVLIVPNDERDELQQVENLKEVMLIVPLNPLGKLERELDNIKKLHVKVCGKLDPSSLITVINNRIDITEEQQCSL
ncbi:MAG: hypothetical protein QW513_00975 [Candidatus Jordarchaeales archaeon]